MYTLMGWMKLFIFKLVHITKNEYLLIFRMRQSSTLNFNLNVEKLYSNR